MEYYNKSERRINLEDLFLEVLQQWKVILVCAIVFAILGGGYSWYRGYATAVAKKAAHEEKSPELLPSPVFRLSV